MKHRKRASLSKLEERVAALEKLVTSLEAHMHWHQHPPPVNLFTPLQPPPIYSSPYVEPQSPSTGDPLPPPTITVCQTKKEPNA